MRDCGTNVTVTQMLLDSVQINELTTIMEPSLLLPEDFKAFSKIRVENQYFNK